MSVDNFIPQVWSAYVLRALQSAHVFAAVANRKYEGEIRESGDTVRINQVGDVTISTYTKNSTSISPETLTDAQSILRIDQCKYFAFEVDDVDRAQTKGGILEEGLNRAVYGLRDTADAYLAGLYCDCGLSHPDYTNSSPIDMTSENIEEAFLESAEVMSDADVPETGRFAIIPPWVTTKFQLAGIANLSDNVDVWKNGLVGRFGGFDLIQSTNVSKNSSSWDKTRIIMGLRNESFTYAEQIVKTEAYRPESAFSDAIKGLHLYGGKIVRPDKTLVLYADKTSEP